MRKEGKFTSGMETQALLGMPVKVLQYKGWVEIQTPDEYTVWAHRKGIVPMSAEKLKAWNEAPKVVVTSFYGTTHEQPNESSQTVSDVVASNRLVYDGEMGDYYKVIYPDGRSAYLSKSLAVPEAEWRSGVKQDAESILNTAYTLVGFPYLWAGTSVKGVDCSGFVRTVLRMHDIIIPRDAWQQALIGERLEITPDYSDWQPGDLVFFGRRGQDGESDAVSHVGFYVGNQRFIHSIGAVHVGSFNPEDSLYDESNTKRLLYAGRILPYINKMEGMNTTATNAFYQ